MNNVCTWWGGEERFPVETFPWQIISATEMEPVVQDGGLPICRKQRNLLYHPAEPLAGTHTWDEGRDTEPLTLNTASYTSLCTQMVVWVGPRMS